MSGKYFSRRWRVMATAFALLAAFSTHSSQSAELQAVADFQGSSADLEMHLYVPDGIGKQAPLVLALHNCTMSGPRFFNNTRFAALADEFKFIVIYPSAVGTGRAVEKCFDSSSPAALAGTGGDPVVLKAMVDHVRSRYSVDDRRIFVTGLSAGGMMTHVLLALYPDLFAAGAIFAGVPFTCFADYQPAGWNGPCAAGQVDRSPEQWGDAVRAVSRDFRGQRPRVQLWHGTQDEIMNYRNLNEAVEQWTNAHGLGSKPVEREILGINTRTRYGSGGGQALVEANSLHAEDHSFLFDDPVDGSLYAREVIRFFGLDRVAGAGDAAKGAASAAERPGRAGAVGPWLGLLLAMGIGGRLCRQRR